MYYQSTLFEKTLYVEIIVEPCGLADSTKVFYLIKEIAVIRVFVCNAN